MGQQCDRKFGKRPTFICRSNDLQVYKAAKASFKAWLEHWRVELNAEMGCNKHGNGRYADTKGELISHPF
jgi:hypothetical protein